MGNRNLMEIADHPPAKKTASAWRFTRRQPISSGATAWAGRAKKDGGSAGRVLVGKRGG